MIVTIIVIIILAAVVILTLSKNNPIESAKEATFKEDVRTLQDELAMYIAKDYTNKAGQRDEKINADKYTTDGALDSVYTYIPSFSKKYEEKFIINNDELLYTKKNLTEKEKEWVNSLDVKGIIPAREEWKKYIAEETEDGVPIPKGFTFVTGTKDTGTVIEDTSHNEFVWIPVDNPDDYKKTTTYIEDLPPFITDETVDVSKYHGFYIGRYEATTSDGTEITKTNITSKPTCQKNKIVWTNLNYSNAKSSAELMYIGDGSSVFSGLLTGKAWDTTCNWIKDYKIKVNEVEETISLTDSRKYGNYSNSIAPANVNGYKFKQQSGFSDKWKIKNIYDLAGNVWEWTYEMNSSRRIYRGGSNYSNGASRSVLFRSNYLDPSKLNDDTGFRIRLYIKTN